MGGSGSGRWGGRRTTDCAFALNLDRLIRQGQFKPGYAVGGTIVWTRNGEPEPVASICYEAHLHGDGHGHARLMYATTRDGERHDTDLRIRMTTTPQPFGSRRWWFICPSTGERVGRLYLPAGATTFASRKAHRLVYQSQRYSPADRRNERMFKLRRQLGNSGGLGDSITKPPRMRWTTFEKKAQAIRQAEAAIAGDLSVFIERLVRRAA